MFRFAALTLVLAAGLLGLRAADPPATELKLATVAESKSEYEKSVGPFLAKHCAACHNAKNPKGDLDLAALDP
ncbi:MAG: hypothetical protein FJ304_10560, partial [Planctomycetes bacterium]|nr:hypothetical protein [Planctomycetota bacterium]